METIYLICLLVGGFFVALSIVGGTEANADADIDVDAGAEADVGADADAAVEDLTPDHEGIGIVDLFSVRSLFLFAAFFGLTGSLLSWFGTGEPLAAVLAVLVGVVVGLGGNYIIQRIGYEHVSSDLAMSDLQGLTGSVLIPFGGERKGKISLVARGHRLNLVARAFENQTIDAFEPGDEVVVVRLDGSVAEVVKPE